MGTLGDLLAWADNKRRMAGRNLSDLVENPQDTLSLIAERTAEQFNDPMNFVGGGLGRTKTVAGFTAPTQAELAGRLRSMGLVDDRGARAIYRLGGKEVADPELLRLIEDETIRRGRILPIGQ